MTDPPTTDPPPDGDPLWQQDFPINRGEELDNSRRQFLKFLGLTSLAFFTGTLGVALKALFEQQRTGDPARDAHRRRGRRAGGQLAQLPLPRRATTRPC